VGEMKKWKLKATTTDAEIIKIGFKWNTTFRKWERLYEYGYLTYTSIGKNRIVVQKVSAPDFQNEEIRYQHERFQDMIDKGLVEQIETDEEDCWLDL
jgi:hypothetical protein